MKTVPPAPNKMQSTGPKSHNNAKPIQPIVIDPPADNQQSTGSSTTNIKPQAEDVETYAEVTKTLSKVIIDQRAAGSMTLLDQKRFDILNSQLIDLMMSQVGKIVNLPQFDDVRLHLGTMRVRSTNAQTFQWLE